jgi:hypothetical protein
VLCTKHVIVYQVIDERKATRQKPPAPKIVLLVAQVHINVSIKPQGWHEPYSVVATQYHCLLPSTQLQLIVANMRVAVLKPAQGLSYHTLQVT